MTDWSKHVHRFAKKHNMSYKQANVSKKCKEAYKKRKTSPRRKRKTSPRRKRRMNVGGFSVKEYEDVEGLSDAIFAAQVAEQDSRIKLQKAKYRDTLREERNKIQKARDEKIAKELKKADIEAKKLEKARRREGRRVVHL